jgi:hypothetical protein
LIDDKAIEDREAWGEEIVQRIFTEVRMGYAIWISVFFLPTLCIYTDFYGRQTTSSSRSLRFDRTSVDPRK